MPQSVIPPLPIGTPLIDFPSPNEVQARNPDVRTALQEFLRKFSGRMTREWVDFLTLAVTQRVTQTAQILKALNLPNQSAAIGSTAIPLGQINQGIYRLSVRARITTPAGVSSALQVTVGGTEGGVVLSFPGTSLTGNLVTTAETRTIFLVSDANAPIFYSTTYASVGAPAMVYSLELAVESLGNLSQ